MNSNKELKIFPFEKEIVGKNIHSVYTLCIECKSWGVNSPLNKTCGNCGHKDGKTYYDAETINNYLTASKTEINDYSAPNKKLKRYIKNRFL